MLNWSTRRRTKSETNDSGKALQFKIQKPIENAGNDESWFYVLQTGCFSKTVKINVSKVKPKLVILSTRFMNTHYLPSYLTALIDIEE